MELSWRLLNHVSVLSIKLERVVSGEHLVKVVEELSADLALSRKVVVLHVEELLVGDLRLHLLKGWIFHQHLHGVCLGVDGVVGSVGSVNDRGSIGNIVEVVDDGVDFGIDSLYGLVEVLERQARALSDWLHGRLDEWLERWLRDGHEILWQRLWALVDLLLILCWLRLRLRVVAQH